MRCKSCSAEVPVARERRCLKSDQSAEVRSYLTIAFIEKGCSEARASEHITNCNNGDDYMCKKCFILITKYLRILESTLEVESQIGRNLDIAMQLFELHDDDSLEDSASLALATKRQLPSTSTPARVSKKRCVPYETSPMSVTVSTLCMLYIIIIVVLWHVGISDLSFKTKTREYSVSDTCEELKISKKNSHSGLSALQRHNYVPGVS